MPAGTLVPAAALAAQLRSITRSTPIAPAQEVPQTWRERIWTVPDQTRLAVPEVAEALGRSRDFVYRHTAPSGSAVRLPHRRLDGALAFTAGEVREWIAQHGIAVAAPVPSIPRLRRA